MSEQALIPSTLKFLPAEMPGEPTDSEQAVMDTFDVAKMIGRIEMARFYETVSEKVMAETAVSLRESKQYKGLPYKDAEGNLKHVSDFDEFCEAFLGKTSRRIRQLMQNYHLLGPDIYEQAEKIGLRQRDYNALKALPAEDQAIIKDAIEAEDRSRVIDLLQEMAVKHGQEKAAMKQQQGAMEQQLQEQALNAKAARQLADDAAKELRELKEANLRASLNVPEQADRDRAAAELREATLTEQAHIIAGMRVAALAVLRTHTGEAEAHGKLLVGQALGVLVSAARQVGQALEVIPTEQAGPAWEAAAVRAGELAWAAYDAEQARTEPN